MSTEYQDMSTDTLVVIEDELTRSWQVVASNRNVLVCVDNGAHQPLLLGIPKSDCEMSG